MLTDVKLTEQRRTLPETEHASLRRIDMNLAKLEPMVADYHARPTPAAKGNRFPDARTQWQTAGIRLQHYPGKPGRRGVTRKLGTGAGFGGD